MQLLTGLLQPATGSGCSPELTPAPAVAPNIFRASCPPEAHLCLGLHEQPIVHLYFVELRIWEYLTLKYRQVALPSPSQLKHLTSLTRGKKKETNPQDLHALQSQGPRECCHIKDPACWSGLCMPQSSPCSSHQLSAPFLTVQR